MLKMKKILLLICFALINANIFAQVGGLSASKLNTPSAICVSANHIEFEPAFSISKNTGNYLQNGDIVRNSYPFENSFGFRFTYGVIDNLEAGFSLPIDVSTVQTGIKYNFFHNPKLFLAGFGGVNFDFSHSNALHGLDAGLITTLQHTDKISTDIQIDWHHDFHDHLISNLLFINTDFGIYIGKIQYIAGLNYQQNFLCNTQSQQLYLTPGVTIEPANNFLMVLSYPFTIFGKNSVKNEYFSFALTITID